MTLPIEARKARLCKTREEAAKEMQRLMDGINGFERCTLLVKSIERTDDGTKYAGWKALVDDPSNEFEYETFYIDDTGHMDWS